MSSRNYNFNTVLVTGGAGGIGRALAEHFVTKGKKVVICGRTESKLQVTSKEIGCVYMVLDTSDIPSIPAFVTKLVADYPDIGCLVNSERQVIIPDTLLTASCRRWDPEEDEPHVLRRYPWHARRRARHKRPRRSSPDDPSPPSTPSSEGGDIQCQLRVSVGPGFIRPWVQCHQGVHALLDVVTPSATLVGRSKGG